jgi:hypothetical protein
MRTAFSCVKNISDMAIAGGEFVLELSTAFSYAKMLSHAALQCDLEYSILTIFANYACAEIVSLQLRTQPVQAAEALLTLLPSSRAFSPNFIRKLAGRGYLSVEPMAPDKNRYSN